MACLSLTSEQIQKARNEGVVDFEKSNVKSIPVVYHLDYDQLELKVALTDSTVVLKEIQRKGQHCQCP